MRRTLSSLRAAPLLALLVLAGCGKKGRGRGTAAACGDGGAAHQAHDDRLG